MIIDISESLVFNIFGFKVQYLLFFNETAFFKVLFRIYYLITKSKRRIFYAFIGSLKMQKRDM